MNKNRNHRKKVSRQQIPTKNTGKEEGIQKTQEGNVLKAQTGSADDRGMVDQVESKHVKHHQMSHSHIETSTESLGQSISMAGESKKQNENEKGRKSSKTKDVSQQQNLPTAKSWAGMKIQQKRNNTTSGWGPSRRQKQPAQQQPVAATQARPSSMSEQERGNENSTKSGIPQSINQPLQSLPKLDWNVHEQQQKLTQTKITEDANEQSQQLYQEMPFIHLSGHKSQPPHSQVFGDIDKRNQEQQNLVQAEPAWILRGPECFPDGQQMEQQLQQKSISLHEHTLQQHLMTQYPHQVQNRYLEQNLNFVSQHPLLFHQPLEQYQQCLSQQTKQSTSILLQRMQAAYAPLEQTQQPFQVPSGWGPSVPTQQPQQQFQAPPGWGPGAPPQQPQQEFQTPPVWRSGAVQQLQLGQTTPASSVSSSPQHQNAPGGRGDRGQHQRQQQQGKQRGPQAVRRGEQPVNPRSQDIVKDLDKLSISSASSSGSMQKKQQTSTQGEKKSVVIRSIAMEYNVGSSKPRQMVKWFGTAGSEHEIETNYLQLNLDKMPNVAYQYDVKFSIDKPTRFRPEAFEEFRTKVLSRGRKPNGFPIAFDTMNIAFSAEKIDTSLLNVPHPVVFIDSATGAEKKVEVTVNEAGDVELHLLKNYNQTGITDRHIRAVQCVDVVLRTAPIQISKQVGRAFYRPPDNPKDLGDGFVLWLGLFQALVLGDIPMLNIDVAHKGFPRSGDLLDVYNTLGRDTDNFIKNLNIIYDPPASFNSMSRLYKANGLVQPANVQTFKDGDGKTMTIAEYFQSKNYQLRQPNAPCLSVGTVRKIMLPIELCRVQKGQDVKKIAGPTQVRELIRHATTSTFVRKQKIMDLFSQFNYNQSEIIRGFNVSVGEQFIKLMARNIPPPMIKYANGSIMPQRGSWQPDRLTYLKSAAIQKWAILVTDNRINDGAVGKFANMIKQGAAKRRMGFDNYVKLNETNPRNLERVLKNFKSEGRSIVFVIISGFGDSYSKVKQIAEINHGLLTQCVKANTIKDRMNSSTIGNIFLKVNSKLNGINHMVEPLITLPLVSDQKEAVMFLGADVTHSSPGQTLMPSVVGVAGSYDHNAFQYRFSWRLQEPLMEMISDMENIIIDQLQNFQQERGKFPTHIIYYRDGVSNGQFKELERSELNAIDRACAKMKSFQAYKPNLTCLVVQKRHHTRFFPPKDSEIVNEQDENQNVLPGTVVDTKITHPGEKQFFLVSHESIKGTAKPTKYCIIRDDASFSADELEAMTYSLCHLFTRCNRAVSYPAPTYYAHHVAKRGRVYLQGATINLKELAEEWKSRNVNEIITSNPMFFV